MKDESVEHYRFEFVVRLHPDAWSLEMLLKSVKTLESCIGDLANLLWVKVLPLLTVESFVESNHILTLFEVDEGIADIALVLEVDWKVEIIVHTFVSKLNSLFEHLLWILVWDVLDHQWSLALSQNFVNDHFEMSQIFIGVVSVLDTNFLNWTRNNNSVVLF